MKTSFLGRILVPTVAGLALLSTSACLKTRAQLRDDDSVPQQVQPVEPKGGYAVDELKQEIVQLTGRIDSLEHEKADASKNTAKLDEELKALEKRMADMEAGQLATLEAIKKLQNQVPPPDSVETFKQGKDQLKKKQFTEAVESFTNYLKTPNGKHAEEATFLRGEAYFADKHYKKAIVDYSKFTDKYSKSAFAPKALLRIGQSFEGLGSKDDAKTYYDLLVDEYPKSPEAKDLHKKIGKKKKPQ